METLKTLIINKEDAEYLFYLAQIILPLVAMIALIYAAAQLKEATRATRALKASADSAEKSTAIIATQAQATLLLSLEERWNRESMLNIRINVSRIIGDAKREVYETNHGLKEKALRQQLRIHCKNKLNELQAKNQETEDYRHLLRFCGFFELVGLLVRRNYIKIEDVSGLFKGPIIDVGDFFSDHIKHRQETEKGLPDGLFENALYLADEIEKLAA